MRQIGRNLTDRVEGFLSGFRYLIHDRWSLFTRELLAMLESGGVKSVRLPTGMRHEFEFWDTTASLPSSRV